MNIEAQLEFKTKQLKWYYTNISQDQPIPFVGSVYQKDKIACNFLCYIIIKASHAINILTKDYMININYVRLHFTFTLKLLCNLFGIKQYKKEQTSMAMWYSCHFEQWDILIHLLYFTPVCLQQQIKIGEDHSKFHGKTDGQLQWIQMICDFCEYHEYKKISDYLLTSWHMWCCFFLYDFDSVFTPTKSETGAKTFAVDYRGGFRIHSSSLTLINCKCCLNASVRGRVFSLKFQFWIHLIVKSDVSLLYANDPKYYCFHPCICMMYLDENNNILV